MPPIARVTRSMPEVAGQEEGQHDVGHEEDRDQRHAADDLDVGGAQDADGRQRRCAARGRAARRAGTRGRCRRRPARRSAAARPTGSSCTDGSARARRCPLSSSERDRDRREPGDDQRRGAGRASQRQRPSRPTTRAGIERAGRSRSAGPTGETSIRTASMQLAAPTGAIASARVVRPKTPAESAGQDQTGAAGEPDPPRLVGRVLARSRNSRRLRVTTPQRASSAPTGRP